ncbi:MAG: hypothetical protein M3Y74_09230 [Chloroflexota bacterium]|nr:hypothetical protein [Chloroflexota bacterium]
MWDGTPTSLDEVATTDVETGDATYLRVACYPQRDDEKSPVDVVMILVSDVSAAVRERRALEEGLARQRQDEEQATARMAELVERNRSWRRHRRCVYRRTGHDVHGTAALVQRVATGKNVIY